MDYDRRMTIVMQDGLRERLLQLARSGPAQRLTKFNLDGAVYYSKSPERHRKLRHRLQKGDPVAAFRREIFLLDAFFARGASVPEIVARDDQRIILPDQGIPVHQLHYDGAASDTVLAKVGAALAGLHVMNLTHGRPSLRDICWDGERITFLDLEAGARLQAGPKHKARDLFLLLHSAMVIDSDAPKLATQLLDAYLVHGERPVWCATRSLARRLSWVDWLALPFAQWVQRRGKARNEFRAIRQTRQLILGHPRTD